MKKMNQADWWAALVIGFVVLASMLLIRSQTPFVPDYDGLVYFDLAKQLHNWLFGFGGHRLLAVENEYVSYWPISNALSVIISALLFKAVDLNVLPLYLNSVYLVVFYLYMRRVRSSRYALLAIVLLCSHTLLFRLFTTLTTEFSVGLWLVAFLATLVSQHSSKNRLIFVLTVLGLLLRTIDVVFVLMATFAYGVVFWLAKREVKRAFSGAASALLALLLTLPIFFQHYKVAYWYIYKASFGSAAASWRSLGGVEGGADVLLQYYNFLEVYNTAIIALAAVSTFIVVLMAKEARRELLLVLAVALSVCLPLFLASSLNIQVVFWVYSALVFISCENFAVLGNKYGAMLSSEYRVDILYSKYGVIVIFLVAQFLYMVRLSWVSEVPYLRNLRELSGVSLEIANAIKVDAGASVAASNFRGLGPLDLIGLAWWLDGDISYGGVKDIYTKNMTPNKYVHVAAKTNWYISAHDDYGFPPHFGINDKIRESREIATVDLPRLGFVKAREITRQGKFYDLWYRPGVKAHLQYASYGDRWISRNLPITVGYKEYCGERGVSGMVFLNLEFMDPGVSAYSPPFEVSLHRHESGEIVSSARVDSYGLVTVKLAINGVECGDYYVAIDKTFNTVNDARLLSANLVELSSELKFDVIENPGNEKTDEQ